MGVNGIYGLSGSGMDIDSMVKVGMMSKQNEYDKMAQKYTKNEWTKSAYLELSSSITTFNTSTLSQYKMSSTMNAKNAESTDSKVVKASAGSSAASMNHSVNVVGLSSNAYLISTNKLARYPNTSSPASDRSPYLADVLFSDYTTEERDGNTYIRGHVAKVTAGADGLDELGYDPKTTSYTFGKTIVQDRVDRDTTNPNAYLQKWDSANNKWVKVTSSDTLPTDPGTEPAYSDSIMWPYTESATHQAWREQKAAWDDFNSNTSNNWRMVVDRDVAMVDITDTTQAAFKFTISDGDNSGTISYTYDQLINGKKTFSDLANDIKNLGLNLTANYDVDHDQFTIYNKESGSGNDITITLDADSRNSTYSRGALTARNFFTNLGFYQSENGQLKGNNGGVATQGDGNTLVFQTNYAKDAAKGGDNEIVIDGVTYKEKTNKVTVDGVTYTATAIGSSVVSINQDTDAIIDKVKSFVADYNKLLSSLYEKYDEKSDSNYKPLTQTQKDSMKEEQIDKWEEKAKKGLLYHDQTIGKIIQKMRSAITTKVDGVDGKYDNVFSLGISTTGIKGQLVLDEDKLKKALAEDSNAVYNIFAKPDKDDPDDYDKMGVAQRLGDVFTEATKNIRSRAGSTSDITEDSDLNNLMRQLQTRMSNFKKMMNTFEDALYKKYDKMETMLAKLGSQLNYVMGSSS